MGKREDQKKEMYEAIKMQNARSFANKLLFLLRMEINEETGLLQFAELVDRVTAMPLDFSYDGFKYVPLDEPFVQRAEAEPDTIRVFDPYNNMKLMMHCLFTYMRYEHDIDVDNDVLMVNITNSKMNNPGQGIIVFSDGIDRSIPNLHLIYKDYYPTTRTFKGDTIYNRDCLKIMDLILRLEDAFFLEFEDLQKLDLVPYDKFSIK